MYPRENSAFSILEHTECKATARDKLSCSALFVRVLIYLFGQQIYRGWLFQLFILRLEKKVHSTTIAVLKEDHTFLVL